MAMADENVRLGMQKEGMLEPPLTEPDEGGRESNGCCGVSDFLVRGRKKKPPQPLAVSLSRDCRKINGNTGMRWGPALV